MSELYLITPPETPLLLPLAREFMAEGNIPGALNEAHFVATLRAHLERGTGFVIVGGAPFRGMICGLTFPDMATAEPCCMEFFWFVNSQERGSLGMRLFDAWEQESVKRGCVRLMMAHHLTNKSEKFERLLTRRGYGKKEQVYMKEVGTCAE